MPNIDLIPDIYYQPSDPYHYIYDNKPLKNIIARQSLINGWVDRHNLDIGNAAGSAGSMTARLAVALEDDGTLKTTAVDAALHSIEEHTDTTDQSSFLEETDEFVRMTERERDKLVLVEDEANYITLSFETAGISNTPVDFLNGNTTFADSTSTAWRYQSGKMYLDLAFPTEAAHLHFYDVTPDNDDSGTLYLDYKIPTYSDFIDGTLRVYVNGVKLSEGVDVYHPGATPDDEWVLNYYTSDYSTGTFSLNEAITAYDVIKIDFDRVYT